MMMIVMMMMMMIVIMKINLEGSLCNLFDTIAQRLNTLSKWLKRSRIRTGRKKKKTVGLLRTCTAPEYILLISEFHTLC